jgi:hypothetical protein
LSSDIPLFDSSVAKAVPTWEVGHFGWICGCLDGRGCPFCLFIILRISWTGRLCAEIPLPFAHLSRDLVLFGVGMFVCLNLHLLKPTSLSPSARPAVAGCRFLRMALGTPVMCLPRGSTAASTALRNPETRGPTTRLDDLCWAYLPHRWAQGPHAVGRTVTASAGQRRGDVGSGYYWVEEAALRLIPRQRPSSAVPATPPVAVAIMSRSDEIEAESDGALTDADDIESDIASVIASEGAKARARHPLKAIFGSEVRAHGQGQKDVNHKMSTTHSS